MEINLFVNNILPKSFLAFIYSKVSHLYDKLDF